MPHISKPFINDKGANCTRLVQTSSARHPKSGPRQETARDRANYESNYDKIFRKDIKDEGPPLCELCKGTSESGTCPCCD